MLAEDFITASRALRAETLASCAGLTETDLVSPFTWRDARNDVRFALGWLSEGDDAARTRIIDALARHGRALSVAQQAMLLAAAIRGRISGALIGLPDDRFEERPAEGEWSLREVLGHIIATDRRYLIAVRYAIERERTTRGGPLRPPNEALPTTTDPAGAVGSPAEVVARMIATGDEVTAELGAVPAELLDAPTNWIHWNLDVRFRLHRFSVHVREHAVQVRKTLDALAFRQTEAQLLLAEASVSRAVLETIALLTPDFLYEAAPSGGGLAISQILEGVLADETALAQR